MTELQMKQIYEWAKPHEAVVQCVCDCPLQFMYVWVGTEGGQYEDACPPLDMNFAFDVCIPKLRGRFGVMVEYHCDVGETWWLTRLDGRTYINKDFYQALLQYLEAK